MVPPPRGMTVAVCPQAFRLRAYGPVVALHSVTEPDSPFGACHCIELPFAIGTDAAWAGAPMLAGAEPDDTDALAGRSTQQTPPPPITGMPRRRTTDCPCAPADRV
jgi:hypothetical protein